MDRDDILDMLRWQAKARGRRAAPASTSSMSMPAWATYPTNSCSPNTTSRTDEYGGSVANRVRLVQQMIEVTKEAVGDTCAVALRISLEELRAKASPHAESEAHEVIERLKDLPDLFDVKMDSSPTDCAASRSRPKAAMNR